MKRKSSRVRHTTPERISPEKAVQFLEDIRLMQSQRDEATQPICIRVPGNVLRALKLRARFEGKKYQSLMIEMLRKSLAQKS